MRTVLFLFLVLICFTANAQKYSKINLSSDQYTFYQLAGAKEKIKGIQHIEVFFAFKTDGDSDTLYIVGVYPDMKKNTELQVALGYSGEDAMFNLAKMYDDPFYRNDTIYVISQLPFKATYVTLRWVWDEKTNMFEPLESYFEDSSWDKLSEGDSLLVKGDVAGAIALYHEMEYPSFYLNEYEKGKEIMRKGHELALEAFKANKFSEAATYISDALLFWTNAIYISFSTEKNFTENLSDPNGDNWTIDETKLWLGDYSLFLYKAGMLDKSIEINGYLNSILPEVAGPYLQLADSYFESGNKSKAKETYKTYSGLMKKLKREKEIPKRVKERMK